MFTHSIKYKSRALRLLMALVWLVLWQLLAFLVGKEFILASPLRVLESLVHLLQQPASYRAALGSSLRILLGFGLGAVLGILLGFLSHRSPLLNAFFAPLLAAARAVPVASFVILALILLSSTWLSTLISLVIALPVVQAAVREGLSQQDLQLQEMARVFAVPRGRRLLRLGLPQLAPYLRQGLLSALGLAFKSGTAAELIGIPRHSIGEMLYIAKVHLDSANLFAWTLVIVGLSLFFARLLSILLKAVFDLLEAG